MIIFYSIISLYISNQYSQRIYGTAWESNKQLKLYKKRIEEAKRRDHRSLGKKLNLFSIQEDAGGGLVFWHPKGAIIRRVMEDYWKDEHVKVSIFIVLNVCIWITNASETLHFIREGMNYCIPHTWRI